MEDDLIFWRQHDDQEITKGQESFFYLENTFKLKFNTLHKKELPLGAPERQAGLKKAYPPIFQRYSTPNFKRAYCLGQYHKKVLRYFLDEND